MLCKWKWKLCIEVERHGAYSLLFCILSAFIAALPECAFCYEGVERL